MARPVRPWFRFYVEAFPDRKIRRLKPAQRWVWVAVLGAARESHEPGKLYVAPGLPMTRRELADYAAVSDRELESALKAMSELSMITLTDALITVTNWDKRQFESDNVTERTRDHRERSREQDRNVPGNTPERTRAFATETETETETEEEQGGEPPAARKRAHQLPDDFAPNETNRRIAAERRVDIDAALVQFADHHCAKGTTFKDWHLAFNTWLRRERPTLTTPPPTRLPHASEIESPPDGLSDEEYLDWHAEQQRKRAVR